jgi:hypothetical protein
MYTELNNQDKINLLNMWINNHQFHIDALEKGIKDYPDSDINGKVTRIDVLNELIDTKAFYIQELDKLNTEML